MIGNRLLTIVRGVGGLQEYEWMLFQVVAHVRMILEEFLQVGVACQKFWVINQTWAVSQLFCGLLVDGKKMVERVKFIAADMLTNLSEASLPGEKCLRAAADLHFHLRMILQKLVQRRMIDAELFVSDQRWIASEVVRNRGTSIEKLVKAFDLGPITF